MKNRIKFLGIALLCCAGASEALTLGRLRGAALIGTPLDVTIQVQVDASEDARSSCFGADVAYGDTTLPPSKVELTFEPSAQPSAAKVHIVARIDVDEPMVSVYLHANCGLKTSKRYVLLADVPTETITAPVPAPRVAEPRVATPKVAAATVPATGATSLMVTKPVIRPATRRVAVKEPTAKPLAKQVAKPGPRQAVDNKPAPAGAALAGAAMAAPKITPKPSAPEPAPVASQPRLQLDPLEAFSDHIVDIDPAIRPAPVEDAVRSLQKKELLEDDLKTLRAVTRANEAALQSVKLRLQEAKAQRAPAALVYGLLALVLVALGGLVYLWRRSRRVPLPESKWAGSASSEHGMSSGESRFGNYSTLGQSTLQVDPTLTPEDEPPKPRKSRKSNTAGAELAGDDAWFSSKVNVTMVEMSDSSFDDLVAKEAKEAEEAGKPKEEKEAKESLKAAPSRSGTSSVRHNFDRSPEALLDIRHQAQFLVSINRSEQAVALLKQVINESKEPHPALCLDLLDLLHKLGLKTDYQQRRYQFNHMFNGNVPHFSQFTHEGCDLEAYPKMLSRITAVWPTAKAQELIETCLFPSRDHPLAPSFELAAFRDLVLLHALVQDTVRALPAGNETPPGAQAATSPTGTGEPSGAGAKSERGATEVDLNFDLSHSEWRQMRDQPAEEVDIHLPVVHPAGQDTANASAAAAEPGVVHENLIDFDLSVPRTPKPSTTVQPGST